MERHPSCVGRAAREPPVRRLRDGAGLALAQGWFGAAAEEMGVTLMRTARSPNIKERLDHSCAVFDERGRLVAQAAHIPVHLGSMPRAVEIVLERIALAPGDIVMLNDPYAGGTHLPDLTLVSPVFLDRPRRQPDFIVASRAHHADIGGAAPGSMPIAREVYEEGLRVPPVLLRSGGVMREDMMAMLLANVRTAAERRADLMAQIGAQVTGERRLIELGRSHGREALARMVDGLIAYGERCVAEALGQLPRGRFVFEDALDDDGLGNGPLPIRVALEARAGAIELDFTGTHPLAAGPVNAVEAVTRAAATYVVRCVLGGDFPVNHGSLSRIRVRVPAASIVSARLPAAVSAGNVETSQRIVDTVFGSFAKALPGRIPAASSGTMNNLLIGGEDPRRGQPFAYYETLGGGHGAAHGADGESAMQVHMTNTRNTPIESLEHAYPLRVITTRIRRGSGGAGRWRGGDGIERTVELLAPSRVTVISDRRTRGPWGVAGGAPGRPGENRVSIPARAGRRTERVMPGKFVVDLPAGTRIGVSSPGGGGYGRPAGGGKRVRKRAGPRSGVRRRGA
jgi:N-methylhydantoinase B